MTSETPISNDARNPLGDGFPIPVREVITSWDSLLLMLDRSIQGAARVVGKDMTRPAFAVAETCLLIRTSVRRRELFSQLYHVVSISQI